MQNLEKTLDLAVFDSNKGLKSVIFLFLKSFCALLMIQSCLWCDFAYKYYDILPEFHRHTLQNAFFRTVLA